MLKTIVIYFLSSIFVFAQAKNIGSDTGYKIPRFVTLKSNEVNLRVGSSTNYPIVLKYTTRNLPVEITDEYDVWRKTKDIEGNEGWIHKTLLQGDRFAIINQTYQSSVKLYLKPQGIAIGEIGKFNIVKINSCLLGWCKIEYEKYKGWIKKENLWGVYKDEKINVSFFQYLINKMWEINY